MSSASQRKQAVKLNIAKIDKNHYKITAAGLVVLARRAVLGSENGICNPHSTTHPM